MVRRGAQEWIRKLGLERHPEGGWFRRVYTSAMLNADGRPVLSSICYLLEGTDFSALHRLASDEQWHFYAGDPLTLHLIAADGTLSETTLSAACPFQVTVPAGCLFGATVEGDYALVGCSVAPGFEAAGFEMPPRAELVDRFPQHRALIESLTRR